jgi:hypothetical protein
MCGHIDAASRGEERTGGRLNCIALAKARGLMQTHHRLAECCEREKSAIKMLSDDGIREAG